MRETRSAPVRSRPAFLAGALAAAAVALAGCANSIVASVPASQSQAAASAVVPAPAGNTVAINAGGPAQGAFGPDRFFSGGATFGNDATIDISQVASNPAPASIFNSERYGAMTYTIPDRSGPQTVTLYFAETYVSGPGQRVFGVSINGTQVLADFDILASAGGANRAIARTFDTTADSSGRVVIGFRPGVQEPKINGIVVRGAGSTLTPQPATPSPPPAAPPSNTPDAKVSAGCERPRTLQNGTITIESGGARSYVLRAPDNYLGSHPYRLVLAYHWAGGTAQQVAAGTGATESPFFGLWDQADNSTIFVAPMGQGAGLNTGWANQGGADVAFTDAILAQVEAGLCIDTGRIFAVGFSYGGAMAYALACARPDVFRGVAVFSGAQLSGCDGGSKPVAYYASHGVGDSVVDIAGGRSLRDHFVRANGVTPQNPPEPAPGSATHVCTTYAGGSPSYLVEWCAFDGDHTPNPHDGGQAASWNPPQAWAFISRF